MTDFPVPQGIPSAITLPELALLQRYAHEAGTVLEIGTHYGFSCIGMALAGAHVTSIDPHNEGPEGASTWERFLANCRRHQVIEPYSRFVKPFRATIETFPLYPDEHFELVFIDGDHIGQAPWRDAEIAMAHLADPGYIAFHDVSPRWPGVWRAAQQLEASGWRKVDQAGTLAVYQKYASGTSGTSMMPAEAL